MIGRNNKQTNKPSHGVVSNVGPVCLFGHHARLSRNKSHARPYQCGRLKLWMPPGGDPAGPVSTWSWSKGCMTSQRLARPAPWIRYAFRTFGIFVCRCGPSPRPIGRHVQSALGPARLLRQRGARMCNDDAPSALTKMSRPARRTTHCSGRSESAVSGTEGRTESQKSGNGIVGPACRLS